MTPFSPDVDILDKTHSRLMRYRESNDCPRDDGSGSGLSSVSIDPSTPSQPPIYNSMILSKAINSYQSEENHNDDCNLKNITTTTIDSKILNVDSIPTINLPSPIPIKSISKNENLDIDEYFHNMISSMDQYDINQIVAKEKEKYDNEIMRVRIYNLLENPKSSKAALILHWYSMSLIVLSVLVTIMETMPEFYTWHGWLFVNAFFAINFCLEFFTRLRVCSNAILFLKQPLNIIDIFTFAPFFIGLIFVLYPSSSTILNSFIDFLYLLRVFRILKLSKHYSGMAILNTALMNSRHALYVPLFYFVVGVVLFSTSMYYLERGTVNDRGVYLNSNGDPSMFTSIPRAIWWCVVTMTTVGYGDIVPVSMPGRILAIAAIFFGVVFLAMPITIVGSNFVQAWTLEHDINKELGSLGQNEIFVIIRNYIRMGKLLKKLTNSIKTNDSLLDLRQYEKHCNQSISVYERDSEFCAEKLLTYMGFGCIVNDDDTCIDENFKFKNSEIEQNSIVIQTLTLVSDNDTKVEKNEEIGLFLKSSPIKINDEYPCSRVSTPCTTIDEDMESDCDTMSAAESSATEGIYKSRHRLKSNGDYKRRLSMMRTYSAGVLHLPMN